jgi:hypothetical protein
LAAGEILMESGCNLYQRPYAPLNAHIAFSWFKNLIQELERRGLSRTVRAD